LYFECHIFNEGVFEDSLQFLIDLEAQFKIEAVVQCLDIVHGRHDTAVFGHFSLLDSKKQTNQSISSLMQILVFPPPM